MNHPSSLIHRCFFCVGSILCLLGLVHCVSPSRPCGSENKCADPQKPHCVGGECKECDNNDHCVSKNCRSDKTCASVGSTETVVPLDGSEQGVSESNQPDESVSPDVALEPVPELQTEPAPESQPESIPEAICVTGTIRSCYPSGKTGCFADTGGKYICKGICATGIESCVNGAWSGQCIGATEPSVELCNGKDDDCDGQIDNRCGFFWTTSAGGTSDDFSSSITTDSAGNLYITGTYEGTAVFGSTTLSSQGDRDVFVAKLSNQGAFLWAVSAGGTSRDYASSITIDSAGNLYIAGYFIDIAAFGSNTILSQGSNDVFVAKLSNQGVFLWAVSAGGTSSDYAISIATDRVGNLYITGLYYGPALFGSTTLSSQRGRDDVFVAKLSNQGVFLWAVSAGGIIGNYVYRSTTDSTGNLYITGIYSRTAVFGSTTLSSQGDRDVFVVKLSNQGAFLWAVSAGGMGEDVSNSIITDSAGNLYIAGYYYRTAIFGNTTLSSQAGSNDVFVAKLNNQGSFLWAASAGGTSRDYASSIAIDSADNLYIAGHYYGKTVLGSTTLSSQGGSDDLFVAKLSNQGSFLWAVSAGGTSRDYASSITIDSAGNLYITGTYEGTTVFGSTTLSSRGNYDVFVAKLR